ncbi:MAG: cell division protein ZapA, partial [Hyphomicrobiales bacterium]
MAQIDVTINNRSYRLACEEGEEDHLRELSRYIDKQVNGIRGEFGQIGDARLLVMASLTIADKLSETYSKLEKLEREVAELRGSSERLRAETGD